MQGQSLSTLCTFRNPLGPWCQGGARSTVLDWRKHQLARANAWRHETSWNGATRAQILLAIRKPVPREERIAQRPHSKRVQRLEEIIKSSRDENTRRASLVPLREIWREILRKWSPCTAAIGMCRVTGQTKRDPISNQETCSDYYSIGSSCALLFTFTSLCL